MTGITGMERVVTADLRKRLLQLDQHGAGPLDKTALAYRDLAREAIERLESRDSVVTEADMDRMRKDLEGAFDEPLDCEGPELGTKGKVDIRRFTCRKG